MKSLFYIERASLGRLGSTLVAALFLPVGRVEPYASFGMGYGWIPKENQEDIATMSRLGIVFRVSKKFARGARGHAAEDRAERVSIPVSGLWARQSRSIFDSVGGSHAYCN